MFKNIVMYHKVKITKLPGKARGGKVNGNRIVPNQALSFGGADLHAGPKDMSVANTISAVPRNEANLEAEGGETVYGDINGDGMAEHLVIKGPRHSSGGVPLNLPDDTFIFSDTRSMRIKDPNMLAQFGKQGGASKSSKSYTPAELAKQYDLSKYRKMLQDPDSGPLERKTAEIMIRNYTMKLGALALAQESKKGFPQGIPEAARPYMEANGISDQDLIPELAQQQQQQQSQQEEMMEQGQEQNSQEEMMEAPEQMEQQMQQPMAQYGYQMDEDSMPFNTGYMYPEYDQYPDMETEYAYEGFLPEAQKGTSTKSKSKEQLEKELRKGDAKVTKTKKLPDGTIEITRADGSKVYAKGEAGEEEDYSGIKAGKVTKLATDKKKYEKDICATIKNSKKPIAYAIAKGWVSASRAGDFAGCVSEDTTPTGKSEFYELEEPIVEKSLDKTDEEIEKKEAIDRGEYVEPDLTEAPQNLNARWMTPDVVNYYGAMKDKSRIKKFMPYAPRVDLEVPRPTYLDPTRELAQQSEYANLMAQQLGQFTGPQAFASNMSGIQGTGAEQAANTLSRINNANVSASNRFAENAANIRNQEQGINQAAAQRLYDQNTMANQQFLNAKTAADQNIRTAFGTGWKNASNLALTNALYPQYDIDPRSGNIWFQGGKDLVGEAPGTTFDKLLRGYIKQGFSPAEATAAAKAALQSPNSQSEINMQTAIDNTAKKGGQMNMGYVMGSNVFPFMFY